MCVPVRATAPVTILLLQHAEDTRALFLYPNVTVLEDKDVAGVDAFCARLAQAPHYLHIPRDAELVRQVFVKVGEPGSTLRDLPHMCSTWLSKACGG